MSGSSSFDYLAQNYDSDFTFSKIGVLQRKNVWKWVSKIIANKKEINILEINCGTGEDALWLASRGHVVTGTDISKQMILVAQQKAQQKKVNIKFFACSFADLENNFKTQKFDLIFSNFGGLNCANEAELSKLNTDFHHLLKPNGLFILVLLGKKCFLEKLYFFLRLDFKKMNRRKQEVSAYLSPNNYVTTWYYTHQEITKIFSSFQSKLRKPIGLFIPPSYLEPLIKKAKPILPIIKCFETLFSGIGLLANYGDHILIVLEKKK